MIGELDPTTKEALTRVATRRAEEARYLGVVEQRSAEVMRVGSRMLLDLIPSVLSATNPVNETDAQRRPARFYIAGVMHLLGIPKKFGLGDLDSREVTLATDVRSMGHLYPKVSASLRGVSCFPGFSRDESNPQAVVPDLVTETGLTIDAQTEYAKTELIEYSGAWVGIDDMPATYDGRDRYVEPARVADVSQQMLYAMSDPSLNPEMQTHAFLAGVSPDLAAQACDVDRPLKEIQFELILPAWARARVGSEV